MTRFFRDNVRRLVGVNGDEERTKQALYERKAAQAYRVIAARRAQMEAASARLVQSLNSMRHKDDGT